MRIVFPNVYRKLNQCLKTCTYSELISEFDIQGFEKTPDHSVLQWQLSIYAEFESVSGPFDDSCSSTHNALSRFKTHSIPDDFLNDHAAFKQLYDTILKIEHSLYMQNDANEAYNALMSLLTAEMTRKL